MREVGNGGRWIEACPAVSYSGLRGERKEDVARVELRNGWNVTALPSLRSWESMGTGLLIYMME